MKSVRNPVPAATPGGAGLLIVPLAVAVMVLAAVVLIDPQMRAWSIPVSLWIVAVGFASARIRDRIMLLALLATYAFFLLGKPIMMGYFGYDGLGWSAEVEDHLILTLSLGLLGIVAGYLLYPRAIITLLARRRRRARSAAREEARRQFGERFASAAELAYWATLPFALAHLVTNVRTASQAGYTGLYVSGQSGFASVTAYGNFANTVAFCVFLAALASRRRTWVVLTTAFTVQALIMVTGDRGDFGTFLLMVFAYLVYRARHQDTTLIPLRRLMLIGGAAVTVLVPVFLLVGANRDGAEGSDTLSGFLYGQGSSLNVIEYGLLYESRLPESHYLMTFASQGILRLIFGGDGGLAGNTVAYAQSGTSLSHSLSYITLGDLYLTGRGVGSSFLAEGFADYGYAGVLLVAVAYGLLVAWIDAFAPGSVLVNAVRLLSIPAIVFAPRGSASGFLADVLSPVTLAVLLGTWLVALLLKDRRREGTPRVTPRVVSSTHAGRLPHLTPKR